LVCKVQGVIARDNESMSEMIGRGERHAEGRPPTYVFGCGFLDFDCYECDLCQEVYGLLLETGSQVACDAACLGIIEAAGGGPEDRTFGVTSRANTRSNQAISRFAIVCLTRVLVSTAVADTVAVECVPLCEDIFSAVGVGTALSTCTLIGLC
jgi:hypothetical protein